MGSIRGDDNDCLVDGWMDNVTWDEGNTPFKNVTSGVANAFALLAEIKG